MSYKSARLAALFPDVYSASDRGSVLGALLDAIGAELTAADESVKVLLRSHWVHYASHDGLDGLAASYGLERRTLRSGALEDDEALRRRLQERVVEYTGGGTVAAVEGSVRSALGLPFDLDDLPLPDGFEAFRRDLQSLVRVVEFSPQPVREGRPYDLYHGTLEARPVTATTSKLIYTLMFDNSMLADDAARERNKAQRTATFTTALDNMKILAEGGTLPPAPPRAGGAGGAGRGRGN